MRPVAVYLPASSGSVVCGHEDVRPWVEQQAVADLQARTSLFEHSVARGRDCGGSVSGHSPGQSILSQAMGTARARRSQKSWSAQPDASASLEVDGFAEGEFAPAPVANAGAASLAAELRLVWNLNVLGVTHAELSLPAVGLLSRAAWCDYGVAGPVVVKLT